MIGGTVRLADAYLELFDELDELDIDDVAAHLADAYDSQAAIAASIVSSGMLPSAPDNLAEQLANLLGLYHALLVADPDRDVTDRGRLADLAAHYELTFRLNSDPDQGLLLFSRARPGRPEAPGSPDTLANLVPAIIRIRAADRAGIELMSVRAVHDLRPRKPAAPAGRQANLATISVTHLPFLAGPDDVEWTRVAATHSGAEDSYAVGPVTSRLLDRVGPGLAALDNTDAQLGMLPESSLDQDLLEKWQEALVSRTGATELQWLLAGTGPTSPPGTPGADMTLDPPKGSNRAVVLSDAGQVIWFQDKRHGFTMDAEQLGRYNLEPVLGDTGPVAEYILHGKTLKVVDAKAGRFAIAICEDHGRLIENGHLCAVAGVTHLLVPVIAPAMWQGGWQTTAARQLASELGVTTVVVNSFAIARFTNPRTGSSEPAPTLAVVLAPHEGPVTAYAASTVQLIAGDGAGTAEADALTSRESVI